jgi:hypothetical protein
MAESVPGWSASLADRYRFERELGRGGISTFDPLRKNPRFQRLVADTA